VLVQTVLEEVHEGSIVRIWVQPSYFDNGPVNGNDKGLASRTGRGDVA